MLELLAIFADEDFGGVEVELVIDREPFDERDIRLVLDLLAQLDFLDEPVEPGVGPVQRGVGLALVLAAVLLRGSEHQSESRIFWFGVILGGAYEYVCSAVTELLFGTVFWDYSGFKFNLGGRINLLYCFFWGIAAVTWMRYGYPLVAKCMGKLKSRIRPWMTAALAVFMAVNMLVSALALARYDARTSGVEAANPVDVVLDAHFDNARMERIYPNAKKVSSHAR